MDNSASENSIARSYLALGSNLGDRVGHLVAAVGELTRLHGTGLADRAALFETEPVGGPPGQDCYVNTAVAIQTSLGPEALLESCLQIEHRLGRRRRRPNDARTIDIDMLLYDDLVCHTPTLVLPHPRMHLRRFVLDPLVQIAGRERHPVAGSTMQQLLNQISDPASGRSFDDDRWNALETAQPVVPRHADRYH